MPESLVTWSEDEWQHIVEAADLYGCSPETIIKECTLDGIRPIDPEEAERQIEQEKRRLLRAATASRQQREHGEGT